jgi:tripartite-type tricarboxylate transporter receptor subunit TctC
LEYQRNIIALIESHCQHHPEGTATTATPLPGRTAGQLAGGGQIPRMFGGNMMDICRRRFVVALIVAMFAPTHSLSDDYPKKPVRIITGPAGAFHDVVTRQLGQQLSERWGQPIIVDNRPGAGMTIAASIAARSPADGYTLLMADRTCIAAAPSLYKKLPYEPTTDFRPITLVAKAPLMLVAHPSIPGSNLADFIAYVRKSAPTFHYASAGPGTAMHMTGELFKQLSGVNMIAVNYKGGGAATQALIGGEVKAGFGSIPNVLPHVKSGRLKSYVVTSAKRFAGAPDIPTAHEQGLPGLESEQWLGMLAPARTHDLIIAKLNRDIVDSLQTADVRMSFEALGSEPSPSTPAEFHVFIRRETAKLRKLIEFAGLSAQ